MSTPEVDWEGCQRQRGGDDDPLITVSLHMRKSQLTDLDQLAAMGHTSRAVLVREAIDRLLTHLHHP